MTETTEQQKNPETQENEEKKQDVLAQHILRAAGLSSDDLMSFQYIFRDAASHLCSQINHYTPLEFTIDVVSLDTLKIDKITQTIGTDTLLIDFSSDRWGNDVIFVLDSVLVELITETFFGATEPKIINRNGRPFSPTECSISEHFGKLLANAMDSVFGTGDKSLLIFTQTRKAPEFNTETFHQSQMFSCTLSIKCGEAEAHLNILMPRSCHRPIHEAITRALRAPEKRMDPLWTKRLRKEVSQAHVQIEAFMQQGSMTLNELLNLKVGQVLPLPINAVKQVKLRSGDKSLYKCSLGKIGKNFSIRVTDPIDEEKEMINELVHG
ncbi:flagellar motor switch protein FliM [Bartonella bacilliformis str. Heidi Mejia]|uniref:FliM/FliN family flagellar motor switch protein n=1 Tax=Bartonella bacilliformis TaxID=774 RepID=UPI0004454F44|nr:FliM/FliN family flagellar motor switch protein [Bartonella bacilliformis]EYS91038.1 flagellar motor switch protein FliM [Bartonella bacilliformis str. Heidi Mejia]KEG18141.1 flagellar motor switch protein FliM [Bartonella bacilliformis Hosp800-02]KEG21769.1 flagellar motor switch protein FliM [Bartonella bacilliformis VAB9028]KEG23144.1 flagellar motor switch protein FliM [Bartonella bacilliformis CAR600-02]